MACQEKTAHQMPLVLALALALVLAPVWARAPARVRELEQVLEREPASRSVVFHS